MLPSCDKLLFFLLWMTAYGNTLTISSTVNSTDLDSGSSTGLAINSSCKTTHQCKGKLVCNNRQCQCCENHIWNGTNCIGEKTFKSLCEHNTECDTTLFCIYGTCQCAQMHYWNGHICVSKKISNETCANSNECGGKLLCEGDVCQCPISLFWNGSNCILKKFNGDVCSSSIECADNMECRDYKCQCPKSEYWDNSKCSSKKSVNDACMKEGECGTTLYCARNVCQCASSDYWTGSMCSRKKDENALCNSSLECKVTLQCRANLCVCCEQNFWNGQFCEKKICVIDKCLNGGRCQISSNRNKCVCGDGYLGDKCQYADGREKDFVIIFHQAFGVPSPRILPTVNRRGKVSVFYFADNKNVSVPLNSINNYYILDSKVLMTNGLHQAGAEIHSNVPINMYGFLFVRSYSEGFFVLPTRFVSVEYVIPSFTVYPSGISHSVFAISAVHPNTVIEINFKMKDGTVLYDNIQYSNNQNLTLVLNKYSTFHISHTSDLTGTRIIASKPIVVVSGNKCNYINGKGSCQPFIEMVLPIDQLDNIYVIPYLNHRFENTLRLLAVNDTSVDVKTGNTCSRKVLKSRDFYDYLHTTISFVLSTSDVMVHVYPHELPNNYGDAFMMTIPGINQYLYDYDFMVPTDFESFISITVPTNAVDGFVLDGNSVNLQNIFSISDEEHNFSSFSIPISSGQHHITQKDKTRFGLWVYGNYTTQEAYGYAAGVAFKT